MFFIALYTHALSFLAVYGIHSLVLSMLFLRHRKKHLPVPPMPQSWPVVLLQSPLYNERFVVERLIDAACALDYPSENLNIQVLDDSADETTELARERVDFHIQQGLQIELLHRNERTGFKTGWRQLVAPKTSLVVGNRFIRNCLTG